MSEKITLTLKRETLEQAIATQHQSVECLHRLVHLTNEKEVAKVLAAQRFFISFLERHLAADNSPPDAPQARPQARRAKHDPQDHAERKAAQNRDASAMCEQCGTPVEGPIIQASMKRFGSILCLPCGLARKEAANGTPAQLQGI